MGNKKTRLIGLLAICVLAVIMMLTLVACGGEHEHKWDEFKITKEATCSSLGEQFHTCQKCKEVETEEIDMLDHTFSKGVCTVCTYVCDHKETKEKIEIDPTCVDKGVKAFDCTICEEKNFKKEDIPANGHTFKENKCDIFECGFICTHEEYLNGKCTLCTMDNVVNGEKVTNWTAELDDTGVFYSFTVGGGASVTSINANVSRVRIPETIDTKFGVFVVNSIADSAFKGRKSLSEIIISKTVTSIGKNAFDSCTGLGSIYIPKTVTSIGYAAFYNCSETLKINCEVAEIDKPKWHYEWNLRRYDYEANKVIELYTPVWGVKAV